MAGSFSGAISFGDVTLYDSDGSGTTIGTNQTEEDMFLVRIDAAAPCLVPAIVPVLGFVTTALLAVALAAAALWILRQ
jgi:hypothetical protein